MSRAPAGEELEQCKTLLNTIMEMPQASAFLEPVDWKSLGLSDYPQIIKHPMDLGTIKDKLDRGMYEDAYDFAEDVRLVWKNAKTYNMPGSGIYLEAEGLSQTFERKFPRIKKAHSARHKYNGNSKDESTQSERLKFTKLVKEISNEQLGQVVEIIDKKAPQALNDNDGDEDLEIEVYHIDATTLRELIDFCDKCIKKAKKNSKKNNNNNNNSNNNNSNNSNNNDSGNDNSNVNGETTKSKK